MNFTLRPLPDTDLTDAIAITVENFTIDGNTLGQYAAPRVRERLASSFRHDEYASRFLVAVKDDGKIIPVNRAATRSSSPGPGFFRPPA